MKKLFRSCKFAFIFCSRFAIKRMSTSAVRQYPRLFTFLSTLMLALNCCLDLSYVTPLNPHLLLRGHFWLCCCWLRDAMRRFSRVFRRVSDGSLWSAWRGSPD